MSEETLIPNPNNSETLNSQQEPMTLSDERIEKTLEPLNNYNPNKKFANRGGKKTQTLLHNIKPKPFSPKKNLNLEKFEQVLKKLELLEFTRIEFDPLIRIEYLADLVSSYDPKKRSSYVNGFRINVTKNDLARALKLPVKKPVKKGSAESKDEVDLDSEVYSDGEIEFIEDFVFSWMLVSEVMPAEIVDWARCIRDGHPEKMDVSKMIWCQVEKELTQGAKLVECCYASHLQRLIRSQRPFLFSDDYVGVGVTKEVEKDMSNENSGDKGRKPITQVEQVQPVPYTDTVMSLPSDVLSHEARAAKRLKSTLVENLENKTDRDLINKRNVGILEQKLPETAEHPKENGTAPVCTTHENVGDNMVEDGSAVEGVLTETHEDVNQEKISAQVDNTKRVVKVEEGEQSVSQIECIDGIIAEEEPAGTLQIAPVNGDKNQAASTQEIFAGLKKVSRVLSMLSSPSPFYTPQGDDPLDEEAENAKQSLIQVLDKNFETIVGSPDEEMVKTCLKILSKNLHKLPRCQGQVIEALNIEFDSACQNWAICHAIHQSNTAFEVQQGDSLRVLEKWQEKDMEIESELETVAADILRLKAELHVKEMTRESLVKQKSDVFNESKMSVDEAEKLLQDMVTVKFQSDVLVKNMKGLAEKWERTRDDFKMKQV